VLIHTLVQKNQLELGILLQKLSPVDSYKWRKRTNAHRLQPCLVLTLLLCPWCDRPRPVTARDLAQACRDAYPVWVVRTLWVLMELAIAATDLAELIGSATALYLLVRVATREPQCFIMLYKCVNNVPNSSILWVLMELAIAATDLAELIGSATALYLLVSGPRARYWSIIVHTVV
jgi:Natural resistance-associated macrophage protein